MKKVTLFGSPLWPQCGPVKELFTENGIEFDYVDMTASMASLRAFLKYRDSSPAFDEVRARGAVGVPCTVINDGEQVIIGTPDVATLK